MVKIKDSDRIIVEHGVIAKISKDTGISTDAVGKVLKGIRITSATNFELIRNRAINFYGGMVAKPVQSMNS